MRPYGVGIDKPCEKLLPSRKRATSLRREARRDVEGAVPYGIDCLVVFCLVVAATAVAGASTLRVGATDTLLSTALGTHDKKHCARHN